MGEKGRGNREVGYTGWVVYGGQARVKYRVGGISMFHLFYLLSQVSLPTNKIIDTFPNCKEGSASKMLSREPKPVT
ncbi:metastasis-associated in colon cancer protein 1 [Sesbania bispinosa]|nr:metastasis-associated in colon cancer protein 1 [Sesbania bispinosa]